MSIKVISSFIVIIGLLAWLVLNHPVEDEAQGKNNYGYFFKLKNRDREHD
ncbi:hypothetical protein [Acetohalobium arabaticum]|uniref:Uncharacterized protein n=1 Tax=Acetohalobium arabaticum (strain ATCC 49924 / DSM 5501 / Z-7288) TaxID=574087 RepID=D9QQR2_ACEAZ|nr:hypothetical protein [Acetohalobium arabaticum]ADL12853.1 hypothetical protein Acear_1340 [Acetohalobium arabaticum DSM 5501]